MRNLKKKPQLSRGFYPARTMKIGILREGKIPFDSRTPLTPAQCKEVVDMYPFVQIKVQKSPMRCFKDSEYTAAGIEVADSVEDCDILMGIKEVPIEDLIHHKTYLFFSHTIKKQKYNRNLLITLLNRRIRMIDYETLTDEKGERVIAFGRYAGVVGAYNGFRAWGERFHLFALRPAHQCLNMAEMLAQLDNIPVPPIRIALTGGGRVAQGAMEVLNYLKIRKVSVGEFLEQQFEEPVYVQLNPSDYNIRKEDGGFEIAEFYAHPERYREHFSRFLPHTDMLIAAAFWDPKAPALFTRGQVTDETFRIRIIADVTCDIDGSVPTTRKPSTIENPFYDYSPSTENVEPAFSSPRNVTVMAVDNLPNELPRDASDSFGRQLINRVFPNLLIEDQERMIERAIITQEGKLTNRFAYLQDFVNGTD